MRKLTKSSPPETPPAGTRTSFSLYRADRERLEELMADLERRGVTVLRTQLLRWLLHTPSENTLFDFAVAQEAFDRLTGAKREPESVDERLTLADIEDEMEKLGRVTKRLRRKGILTNHSLLLRSLIRQVPAPEWIAPSVRDYLASKPDGRSAAARKKKEADGRS